MRKSAGKRGIGVVEAWCYSRAGRIAGEGYVVIVAGADAAVDAAVVGAAVARGAREAYFDRPKKPIRQLLAESAGTGCVRISMECCIHWRSTTAVVALR